MSWKYIIEICLVSKRWTNKSDNLSVKTTWWYFHINLTKIAFVLKRCSWKKVLSQRWSTWMPSRMVDQWQQTSFILAGWIAQACPSFIFKGSWLVTLMILCKPIWWVELTPCSPGQEHNKEFKIHKTNSRIMIITFKIKIDNQS